MNDQLALHQATCSPVAGTLTLVQLGHHPSCNSVQQLVINGHRLLACYWKALLPNRLCKCWWQEKKKKKVDILSACSDFSQVMDSLWVTKEKNNTLLPPPSRFFFFSIKELSKITVMQKDVCRANTVTMAFSLLSYSHFERLDLYLLLSVHFFEVIFWQKFTMDV